MVDLRTFRRVCHDAARHTGGEVIEFRIAHGVTPNFHQGVIGYRGDTVAVACVRGSALLAIAVPRDIALAPARESGPLTFVDRPELAAALAEAREFRVLTTAELSGSITAAEWADISSSDLRYWRPGSLGEALFNYWD